MDDATQELILRNLWPMLRATVEATIPLTAISFVLGLVLALFVALARISRIRPLSLLARGYVSVIRGTPLLVQLFIVFYALPQFGVVIDPFPSAVITVAFATAPSPVAVSGRVSGPLRLNQNIAVPVCQADGPEISARRLFMRTPQYLVNKPARRATAASARAR